MMKARVFCLFMTMAFLVGCSSGDQPVDPKLFFGAWQTDAAKYADRFIDIKENTIAFGTGGQDFQSYSITGMVVDLSTGRPQYTIYYRNLTGDDFQMTFYSDSSRQVIRLKHQEQIEWKRRKGS